MVLRNIVNLVKALENDVRVHKWIALIALFNPFFARNLKLYLVVDEHDTMADLNRHL